MKYFSETDVLVNAECEHCKEIINILRKDTIPTPTGFSLNPPGGVRCFCGVIHHNILGNATGLPVQDYSLSKKCWNCNEEMEVLINTCLSCGSTVGKRKADGMGRTPDETKAERKKYLMGCGIPVLCIVVVILFFVWLFSGHRMPSTPAPATPQAAQTQTAENALPVYSDKDVPKFTIISLIDGGTFSLLVSKETTKVQLEALVLYMRDARKGWKLSRLLPAIAKLEKNGTYTMQVYVFTEETWASKSKFSKYIHGSAYSKSDEKFASQFARHIKAYYFYSSALQNLQPSHPSIEYEKGCAGDFKYDLNRGEEACTKKLF